MINKKIIPMAKPIKAGNQLNLPYRSFDDSIDGIINDQIDAAIITPPAKPNNVFSNFGLILSFKKKTHAAPNVVPINGMIKHNIICVIFLIL